MEIQINRWCNPHWTALREAIFAGGLGHLVPRSGEAAAAMMLDELRAGGARDVEGFDPLMRAYWAISSLVLAGGGNPFECPLCQIQRHHNTCGDYRCRRWTVAETISGCVDALHEYARSKGLLREGSQRPPRQGSEPGDKGAK